LRITDFGLASVAGELKDIHSGTPADMAPEQLSGQEGTTGSDICALGVVLHLAHEVDRVIRRCLAEDPALRPFRRCKARRLEPRIGERLRHTFEGLGVAPPLVSCHRNM
jgi:hypothetical protein